jgi:hypothetical protein
MLQSLLATVSTTKFEIDDGLREVPFYLSLSFYLSVVWLLGVVIVAACWTRGIRLLARAHARRGRQIEVNVLARPVAELFVVAMLIATIVVLALEHVIGSEATAALLGGIAGYVLRGFAAQRGTEPPPPPEPREFPKPPDATV